MMGAAAKHGGKGKRGWKKLHLGVDGSGAIVAEALTDANVDDAKTGLDLINAVEDDLASFTADPAYDTVAICEGAAARDASVIVPPARTAAVSRRGQRSEARDRTIRKVKKLAGEGGRRSLATIARARSRTSSFATSRSSETGFERDRQARRRPRRCSRVTC